MLLGIAFVRFGIHNFGASSFMSKPPTRIIFNKRINDQGSLLVLQVHSSFWHRWRWESSLLPLFGIRKATFPVFKDIQS